MKMLCYILTIKLLQHQGLVFGFALFLDSDYIGVITSDTSEVHQFTVSNSHLGLYFLYFRTVTLGLFLPAQLLK